MIETIEIKREIEIGTETETEKEIEIEEGEEEEEDLPGGTRGHVVWVRLPNEDEDTLDRLGDTAGILCPEAEAAPSMIVTDPPAGNPCLRQRDVGRPILVEDHARRGDSNVGDPDRAPLWAIHRSERIQSVTKTFWRIESHDGIRRRKLRATRWGRARHREAGKHSR